MSSKIQITESVSRILLNYSITLTILQVPTQRYIVFNNNIEACCEIFSYCN